MFEAKKHIIIQTVTAIAVTVLLGCTGGGNQLRKLQQKPDGPTSEGTGIVLRYVDSGKVTALLRADYMRQFSNELFPYDEFPDGINLTFVDEENRENFIRSDYAIKYTETGLVDLRNNVVLITSDSDTLKAQQLYWDHDNSWVYTNKPYTLISADGSRNDGDLFDSSEDFTNFVSLNNSSKQYIKEETVETQNDTIQ